MEAPPAWRPLRGRSSASVPWRHAGVSWLHHRDVAVMQARSQRLILPPSMRSDALAECVPPPAPAVRPSRQAARAQQLTCDEPSPQVASPLTMAVRSAAEDAPCDRLAPEMSYGREPRM